MEKYLEIIDKIPASTNPKVPEPAAKLLHFTDIQLRFTDVDMLGHINNNSYLQFMDLAKTRFFTDLRGDIIHWDNPGIVIANINISFYAQAFMGEKLGVLTGVVSISERSFILEQRIVNIETGVVNCIAHTVMVSYSKKTMKSTLLSDDWRRALSLLISPEADCKI